MGRVSDESAIARFRWVPRVHGQTVRRVGRYVLVGFAVLVAASVAPASVAVVDARFVPSTVRLAPGLSVEAWLRKDATSVAEFGSAGTLVMPQAHADVPLLGRVGVELRVNTVNAGGGADTLSQYAVLADDPEHALVAPIRDKIVRDMAITALAVGGAIDVAIAIVVAGLFAARRRRRREEAAEDVIWQVHAASVRRSANAPARATLDLAEQARQLRPRLRTTLSRRRRLSAAAAAGVVALGLGLGAGLHSGRPPRGVGAAALPARVTADVPFLRGARVSGVAAKRLISSVIIPALDVKDSTDRGYRSIVSNFATALAGFRSNGGLSYQSDTSTFPVLIKADEECNIPFIKTLLPRLIAAFEPTLILDAGDLSFGAGATPIEPLCARDEAQALQDSHHVVPEIYSVGNHDSSSTAGYARDAGTHDSSGALVHAIFPLDGTAYGSPGTTSSLSGKSMQVGGHRLSYGQQGNSITVDEQWTFVSIRDGRRSRWGEPETVVGKPGPATHQDKVNALARQGSDVADLACALSGDTEHPPIVLTMSPHAGYDALARGCTTLNVSGDIHKQHIRTYQRPDGTTAVEFNQGTASGPGTIYSTPQVRSVTSIALFNTATHEIEQYINIVVHPDLTVDISTQTLPPPQPLSTFTTDFPTHTSAEEPNQPK